MVMDPQFWEFYKSMNRGNEVNENNNLSSVVVLSEDEENIDNGFKFDNTFFNQNYKPIPPDLGFSNLAMSSSGGTVEGDHPHEDFDFSDVVLKYISQMLMEEDMEEKSGVFQESSALQAAEKSFYEVIGEKYPPPSPPDNNDPTTTTTFVDQFLNIPDETTTDTQNFTNICNNFCSISSSGIIVADDDPSKKCELGECDFPRVSSYQTNSQASSNSGGTSIEGFVDSPISTLRIVPDILYETESVVQFKTRLPEAARKFLPKSNNAVFVDLEDDGSLHKGQVEEAKSVTVMLEENHASEYLNFNEESKGKKNRHPPEGIDLEEGRSSKQLAIYAEATVRSEMFDLVLLCSGGKSESDLREALQNVASKNLQHNGQLKGSNGGKGRGKKKGVKKDMVDLRTLLTLCAQAVAANDQRTTYELLKQIRQHSSPTGDGMQRLAHYFANGLEARLAGSGTKIHESFLGWETSAANKLKAYHLFSAVCPFKKLSIFFSNKTIMHVAKKATKLHIIDFGILYGFQWPSFIQRLSSRLGGPPKLRITGIDFPQPGFRPAERVRETARRLANYAETFNVPFEFSAIAQKWETIQIEDLNLKDDEVIVVNCMYMFRSLLDETVMVESPRNIVLNLIRKMNPDVFIQGVVNGAYGAPFFITRFREALFHFSTLFDMLDANVPREIQERILLEKEVFGREAINVIACEGGERIERPETYKQWQVRNRRAGLVQLPLNSEIMKMAKDRVKTCYHKDFLIDEDGQWMVQGWKGRITFAMSSWRPAH